MKVLGVPPTNNHQSEDKNEDKILFNLIGDSEPEVVINRESLAELDEDSQTLVSQIVDQLEQTGKFYSMLSPTQYEQEKPEKYEQEMAENCESVDIVSTEEFTAIQPQTLPHNKKNMLCFLDSFNDGFALIINTMGTVLFLGKIVNYSCDLSQAIEINCVK